MNRKSKGTPYNKIVSRPSHATNNFDHFTAESTRISPGRHGWDKGKLYLADKAKRFTEIAPCVTGATNDPVPEMSTATPGVSPSSWIPISPQQRVHHTNSRRNDQPPSYSDEPHHPTVPTVNPNNATSTAQPGMYQPQYPLVTPHGTPNPTHYGNHGQQHPPPPYAPIPTAPYPTTAAQYPQPMMHSAPPLVNVAQPMVYPQQQAVIVQGQQPAIATTMALATGTNTVVVMEPSAPVVIPQNAGYPDNKDDIILSCFVTWCCCSVFGLAAFFIASRFLSFI